MCYLSLSSNPPTPHIEFENIDKLGHFLAYFILMIWFSQLYKTTRTRLFYVLFFILMGTVLEILQGLGGVRHFEYYDMLANSLGVAVAWFITKGRLNNLLLLFEAMITK